MSDATPASSAGGTGSVFHLRLYVAGDAPNSAAAITNLRALCSTYLPEDQYRIEVVDVLQDPQRVLRDGVLITPLLVKLAPAPVCRVAGTLGDVGKVTHALGLDRGGA